MARINRRVAGTPAFTHEGGPAFSHMTPIQALRRSVLSCLLFEDEFYEDGQTIAARIVDLAGKVTPEELAALAREARGPYNLRSAPMLLLAALAKHGAGRPDGLVRSTIAHTIQRADELTELPAIYWRMNGRPETGPAPRKLSGQLKKGLADAFGKFDEYALGKYNRANAIKLKDVLRLVRPKPKTPQQADLWKRLNDDALVTPDTWEVALSGGENKKEAFERLLREGKLGYLALLRNLRNMQVNAVDETLVKAAILARKNGAERVLPFRFIAAARAAVQYEKELDAAMVAAIAQLPKLAGKTIVLVDISASMDASLSARHQGGRLIQSDMKRVDAAAALAVFVQGDKRVFSFSNDTKEVPARNGMAGIDAIQKSQHHSGTYLGAALAKINGLPHDRLIVITDEQSADALPDPVAKHAYMINVASNEHGVGYGRWVHIDGFSERVIHFIHELEAQRAE